MNKSENNNKSCLLKFGFSDQQLETEVIHNNNEAMVYLQKGNLQKVYTILNQTNKYLLKMKKNTIIQKKAYSITLNSWACYYHHRKCNEDALQIMNEAIKIEQQLISDNLSISRAYLNKCVILSEMKKHEQALEYANKAIEYLERQKNCLGNNRKRKQNLSEIFALSFYNIAAQFQYLKNDKEAIQAYTKGYNICKQMMGQRHNLAVLMKRNLKLIKEKDSQLTVGQSKKQTKNLTQSHRYSTNRTETEQINFKTLKKFNSKKHQYLNRKKNNLNMSTDNSNKQKFEYTKTYLFPETYGPFINLKEKIKILFESQEQDDNKNQSEVKNIYLPEKSQKKYNSILPKNILLKSQIIKSRLRKSLRNITLDQIQLKKQKNLKSQIPRKNSVNYKLSRQLPQLSLQQQKLISGKKKQSKEFKQLYIQSFKEKEKQKQSPKAVKISQQSHQLKNFVNLNKQIVKKQNPSLQKRNNSKQKLQNPTKKLQNEKTKQNKSRFLPQIKANDKNQNKGAKQQSESKCNLI